MVADLISEHTTLDPYKLEDMLNCSHCHDYLWSQSIEDWMDQH